MGEIEKLKDFAAANDDIDDDRKKLTWYFIIDNKEDKVKTLRLYGNMVYHVFKNSLPLILQS